MDQVRKHTMLERALRRILGLGLENSRVLGQKAYNAREGIETHITATATQARATGQKAYNAREGIETFPRT